MRSQHVLLCLCLRSHSPLHAGLRRIYCLFFCCQRYALTAHDEVGDYAALTAHRSATITGASRASLPPGASRQISSTTPCCIPMRTTSSRRSAL